MDDYFFQIHVYLWVKTFQKYLDYFLRIFVFFDDIFYRFNSEYLKYKESDIKLENIIEKYGWYYLNTYVTNNISGKLYIVDGQQRLTTLSLILIKLKHLANSLNSLFPVKYSVFRSSLYLMML